MKYISLILLATVFSAAAMANDECIPTSAIICTIYRSYLLYGNQYPSDRLSTTLQNVDSIEVSDAGGQGESVNPALEKKALARLRAEAQQLKDAGVCKVIIDELK